MSPVTTVYTIAYILSVALSQDTTEYETTMDTTMDTTLDTTEDTNPMTTYEDLPEECYDECDAFSIYVKDYDYSSDSSDDSGDMYDQNLCITYKVERLFSEPYLCEAPIKYLVLGICDDDYDYIDVADLNGLVQSFDVISLDSESTSADSESDNGDRRRLGYSSKCYGTNSNGVYGIKINLKIEDEATFEICLKDVFEADIDFSQNVRFRRGYMKYSCAVEWVRGLPCIDYSKFHSGMYDSAGFNSYGSRYGKRWKRKRRYKAGDVGIEMVDSNMLSTAESPMVKWEVLSCIALAALCVMGVCVYFLILRKKRLRATEAGKGEHERVKSFEDEQGLEDCEFEDEDGDGKQLTETKTFERSKYTHVNEENEVEMENVSENETD